MVFAVGGAVRGSVFRLEGACRGVSVSLPSMSRSPRIVYNVRAAKGALIEFRRIATVLCSVPRFERPLNFVD
jgi:hypothetical protein